MLLCAALLLLAILLSIALLVALALWAYYGSSRCLLFLHSSSYFWDEKREEDLERMLHSENAKVRLQEKGPIHPLYSFVVFTLMRAQRGRFRACLTDAHQQMEDSRWLLSQCSTDSRMARQAAPLCEGARAFVPPTDWEIMFICCRKSSPHHHPQQQQKEGGEGQEGGAAAATASAPLSSSFSWGDPHARQKQFLFLLQPSSSSGAENNNNDGGEDDGQGENVFVPWVCTGIACLLLVLVACVRLFSILFCGGSNRHHHPYHRQYYNQQRREKKEEEGDEEDHEDDDSLAMRLSGGGAAAAPSSSFWGLSSGGGKEEGGGMLLPVTWRYTQPARRRIWKQYETMTPAFL